MKTPSKIIVAVALAGLAVAGGSAFTAGAGLDTAGVANPSIGGTAELNITGATLTALDYTYNATSVVTGVNLTFAETLAGKSVEVTFTADPNTGTWACTNQTDVTKTNCANTGGGATKPSKISVAVTDA